MITSLAQNVTAEGPGSQQPPAPVFFNVLSLNGDSLYPTGGTPGFQMLVRALFGDNRTVLAVIAQDCGAYSCFYDAVNDKLKVLTNAGVEVANAFNLSAVPFNILVISY